jgi:hypothetical protein
MRTHVFLRCLPLLLALTSPAILLAQFQQPTDEELKMTADPKAPGAAAVYLNFEDISNDQKHVRSYYARIKVLTEKGKELATVNIPYEHNNFQVTDIKARTIHSDGTVIPLIEKPEDRLIAKTKSNEGDLLQFSRKVITLPSVEVGSILEYRFDIRIESGVPQSGNFAVDRSSSPLWEIQRQYFVHQAHYAFSPYKNFLSGNENSTRSYLVDKHRNADNTIIWRSILPVGVAVKTDSIGRYSLDMTDIPPRPNEDWMPPVESILFKVQFYYSAANNQTDYWVYETKYWSKDVDRLAEPTGPIKQAVAVLIAPGDSALDKAKKLYKAVQTLDNTDFSRKKSESELKQMNLKPAKRAEDTWAQKSGSSKDITLLYLAMLHAAGLTAYDVKVADRQKRIFDPGYLNFDQLDDDLIIANIDGKEIFLDPGEKMCPFQTVHWKHSGATGIRQGTDGRSFLTSPPQAYSDNKFVRTGDITLDEHGVITGTLRFAMNGQEALRWRQFALRSDPDEFKKQFDHSLESIVPIGVVVHVDHFLGLDNSDVNLVAFINVHGTPGAVTSNRILLPGFFLETRSGHPFVNQDTRLQPVDMHYGDQVSDQIAYHLPANMTVETAPQDAKIPWEGHAVFVTKTVSVPGQITIVRSMARAFTFVKPEEYNDLRGFYQKVAAADQQQIVLSRAPSF